MTLSNQELQRAETVRFHKQWPAFTPETRHLLLQLIEGPPPETDIVLSRRNSRDQKEENLNKKIKIAQNPNINVRKRARSDNRDTLRKATVKQFVEGTDNIITSVLSKTRRRSVSLSAMQQKHRKFRSKETTDEWKNFYAKFKSHGTNSRGSRSYTRKNAQLTRRSAVSFVQSGTSALVPGL